jgi:hypothetical protein
METTMQVAHLKTFLGQTYSVISVTTAGNQGQRLISTVKPGNRFWAWPSIGTPPGSLASINFDFGTGFSWGDGAPTCTNDANQNLAILAELAEVGPAPSDVLTFNVPA